MSKEIDIEEDFHSHEKKGYRKKRKLLSKLDRSKFKKTDLKKSVASPPPNLPKARVIAITKEGICLDIDGEKVLASLKGGFKKEKTEAKNLIAVGDVVRYTSDYSIRFIEERYSFLSRNAPRGNKEQLIAVNIDQAIIALSVVNPPLKPALVDRYLIAAEKGNIHPIIVINKIDLLEKGSEEKKRYEEFLSSYEKLGIPILSISTAKLIGLEALRGILKDKTSVFSGQSGVGKSSLLNALFGFNLKTGELTQKTIKGSHTTTMAELLPIPGGGYCVDTPGIRSFGLFQLQKGDVQEHFREFFQYPCKYPDCVHKNEPQCAVKQALDSGDISLLRYESYQTLMEEALGGSDNRSRRKEGS